VLLPCPLHLRYQDRWNRNDSTKGCDIIGFKFVGDEPHHREDELFIFESKSGMTRSNTNRLQDAITDSMEDHLREAMTLNAMKPRMLVRGEREHAEKVKRFQNEAARPFKSIYGRGLSAGGEWIRTLRPARDQPKWEPSRCRSTSDFQRHDEGLSASSSGGDQHSKLDKVTRLTFRSRHGREEF
jgi:hypothetical protein